MTNREWLNQLPNDKMCGFLEHENFAPYCEDGYPDCTACSIPHNLANKGRNCSKCIANWLKAEHK